MRVLFVINPVFIICFVVGSRLQRAQDTKNRRICIHYAEQILRFFRVFQQGLCYRDDRSSFKHRVAFACVDCSHGSSVGGFDDIFHLHGFEHRYLLALFYRIPDLYRDFDDYARERGSDRFPASRSRSCGRCRSRRRSRCRCRCRCCRNRGRRCCRSWCRRRSRRQNSLCVCSAGCDTRFY